MYLHNVSSEIDGFYAGAQEARRCLLAPETRVKFQVISSDIRFRRICIGAVFSPNHYVSRANNHPAIANSNLSLDYTKS